jgi:hypothetical protein
MSYTINLTNGSILTSIVDGTIDQQATDITLIGKNSTGYGVFVNDNFVHLLENFANTSQPSHPIIGQLWFDTTQNRLKVYDGAQFKVSGGSLIGPSAPSSLTTGDIWINSATSQLFFNDGTQNVLAGPIYSSEQKQSGFIVEDVLDVNKISHTVVYLYVGGVLLGIFSKDAFTPGSALTGFSGNIKIGFNVSSYSGITFNVPVLSSQTLIGANGSTYTAEDFVSLTDDSNLSGSITIANTTPLILGTLSQTQVNVSSGLFQLQSNAANQDFQISILNSGNITAFYINSAGNKTGIFTNNPQATLDVNGTFRISSSTPATSTSVGVAGQIAWSSTHMYVCVATNSWKRTAIASW